MDQVGATKIDVALPFGKKGEKPFGVTANDVPLSSLIIRSRDLNAPPQGGGAPRRKSRALIEHMGYTVADFDRERAKAELKSLGVENVRDGGLYSLHMTDAYGYDVQISGVANNALTDGARSRCIVRRPRGLMPAGAFRLESDKGSDAVPQRDGAAWVYFCSLPQPRNSVIARVNAVKVAKSLAKRFGI
jgi:hypothetical protein